MSQVSPHPLNPRVFQVSLEQPRSGRCRYVLPPHRSSPFPTAPEGLRGADERLICFFVSLSVNLTRLIYPNADTSVPIGGQSQRDTSDTQQHPCFVTCLATVHPPVQIIAQFGACSQPGMEASVPAPPAAPSPRGLAGDRAGSRAHPTQGGGQSLGAPSSSAPHRGEEGGGASFLHYLSIAPL